jgi:dTMP kinase
MGGIFITFEGIECCGKSTQAGLLANRLVAKGIDVLPTREPGGTTLGENIRRILCGSSGSGYLSPIAEVLLFEASRAQHVAEKIVPAIDGGKVVICDRFTDSTLAYQGDGRGIDRSSIKFLNDFATQNRLPDLTIFIDIDVGESFRRICERNGIRDRMEGEGEEFFNRVRLGYLQIAAGDSRFVIIQGTGSRDSIGEAIFYEFTKRFL